MLACWFGVDRSTITRAIGEVQPLLAQRGCTVARGIRLRTLAEVIEYLGVGGTGVINGAEVRVRKVLETLRRSWLIEAEDALSSGGDYAIRCTRQMRWAHWKMGK